MPSPRDATDRSAGDGPPARRGRRGFLAATAGAIGALAGCSGAGEAGDRRTVTPAPVPDGESGLEALREGEAPTAGGLFAAHRSALSGRAVRVRTGLLVRVGGRTRRVRRVVSRADGAGAVVYRRYRRFVTGSDGVDEVFRGGWYDGGDDGEGEAVVRTLEDEESTFGTPEDPSPPSLDRRLDRGFFEAAVRTFDPAVEAGPTGFRLSTDREVARSSRLTAAIPDVDVGRFSAAVDGAGVVRRLEARVRGEAIGGPGIATYVAVVDGLGATTVERPTEAETAAWVTALRTEPPVEATFE